MAVTKTTHQEGTGAQPTPGQTVTIEYTGFLKDTSKPDNKGNQYVKTVPRRLPDPPPEADDFSTRKGSTALLAAATS